MQTIDIHTVFLCYYKARKADVFLLVLIPFSLD